jgi:acylphosphatase
MKVRRRIVVEGEVQGVFFRSTCRREAQSRGVTGWVRNRPNGTVEAVLEGEPDAVDDVIAWARQGPPAARVSRVQVTEEDPVGERSFQVR